MSTVRNNQRGQGLIEYLVIVSIMAIGTLITIRTLGQNIKAQFTNIAAAISGKRSPATMEELSEKHYRLNDMGNFFEGASDNGQKSR